MSEPMVTPPRHPGAQAVLDQPTSPFGTPSILSRSRIPRRGPVQQEPDSVSDAASVMLSLSRSPLPPTAMIVGVPPLTLPHDAAQPAAAARSAPARASGASAGRRRRRAAAKATPIEDEEWQTPASMRLPPPLRFMEGARATMAGSPGMKSPPRRKRARARPTAGRGKGEKASSAKRVIVAGQPPAFASPSNAVATGAGAGAGAGASRGAATDGSTSSPHADGSAKAVATVLAKPGGVYLCYKRSCGRPVNLMPGDESGLPHRSARQCTAGHKQHYCATCNGFFDPPRVVGPRSVEHYYKSMEKRRGYHPEGHPLKQNTGGRSMAGRQQVLLAAAASPDA